MREIKYRGKRVDNKEWVYGLPQYLTEYAKDFKEVDGIQCNTSRELYDIIPGTVGVFVGLEDSNGVAIYEGDRFCTDDNDGSYYLVEYDKDICGFTVALYSYLIYTNECGVEEFGTHIECVDRNVCSVKDIIDLVIIGNIHE